MANGSEETKEVYRHTGLRFDDDTTFFAYGKSSLFVVAEDKGIVARSKMMKSYEGTKLAGPYFRYY